MADPLDASLCDVLSQEQEAQGKVTADPVRHHINKVPLKQSYILPMSASSAMHECTQTEQLNQYRLLESKPALTSQKNDCKSSKNPEILKILSTISEKFMADSSGTINDNNFKPFIINGESSHSHGSNLSIERGLFPSTGLVPLPSEAKRLSPSDVASMDSEISEQMMGEESVHDSLSQNITLLRNAQLPDSMSSNVCLSVEQKDPNSAIQGAPCDESKEALCHSNDQNKFESQKIVNPKSEPEYSDTMQSSSQNNVQNYVKKPIDIMMHKDKINILRQMSQIFNEEQPIVVEDASSASEDESIEQSSTLPVLDQSCTTTNEASVEFQGHGLNSNAHNKKIYITPKIMNRPTLKLKLKSVSANGTEKISSCTLTAKDASLSHKDLISLTDHQKPTAVSDSFMNLSREVLDGSVSNDTALQSSLCSTIENVISQAKSCKNINNSVHSQSQMTPTEHLLNNSLFPNENKSICSSMSDIEPPAHVDISVNNSTLKELSYEFDNSTDTRFNQSPDLLLSILDKNKENEKIYHVPFERKPESEKISIDSYMGKAGECVDIIDGFTFVSYENETNLLQQTGTPRRPRTGKLKKRKFKRWNKPRKPSVPASQIAPVPSNIKQEEETKFSVSDRSRFTLVENRKPNEDPAPQSLPSPAARSSVASSDAAAANSKHSGAFSRLVLIYE